jgi:3-oxoacyl-[acyl-carrier-protein] synthase III
MTCTLGGYVANLATDGTYVVAARNAMTIGYLRPTSGGWKGIDILTTMNGRHVTTAVCESVTDAFEEFLRKGGWHTN